MNVTWDLGWGGSQSTKPCVFQCAVAAASDEGQVLCMVVAAAVVSGSNRLLLGVLQHVDGNRIVMAAWTCTRCCKTHCNGCMNDAMLHRAWVGEEAGARNLVFFRAKWLQPVMKGRSCVRQLRLRSFQGTGEYLNKLCAIFVVQSSTGTQQSILSRLFCVNASVSQASVCKSFPRTMVMFVQGASLWY